VFVEELGLALKHSRSYDRPSIEGVGEGNAEHFGEGRWQ
jgi:hypothetical protein